MLGRLLEKGANLTLRDSQEGYTPLHYAAKGGHTAAVEFLLKKGADITAQATNDGNALHIAICHGHTDVATLLMSQGAASDTIARAPCDILDNEIPLHTASRVGNVAVVRLLLDHGIPITAKTRKSETPLHIAAKKGHEPIAALLLERGAEVDIRVDDDEGDGGERYSVPVSATPLMIVSVCCCEIAEEGRDPIVLIRLLLEHGADATAVDIEGNTALHYAAGNGPRSTSDPRVPSPAIEAVHRAAIELLISGGCYVDAPNAPVATPLRWAVSFHEETMVKVLLENGADAKTRDNMQRTMLHEVFEFNSGLEMSNPKLVTIVEMLIAHGVDPNAVDKMGCTALHRAINHSPQKPSSSCHPSPASRAAYRDAVEALIKGGCDVDKVYGGFPIPLHSAVAMGGEDMMRVLLENGADVNITNDEGETALHVVVESQALWAVVGVAKTLIEAGCEVRTRDSMGRTAMDKAIGMRSAEALVAVLRNAEVARRTNRK